MSVLGGPSFLGLSSQAKTCFGRDSLVIACADTIRSVAPGGGRTGGAVAPAPGPRWPLAIAEEGRSLQSTPWHPSFACTFLCLSYRDCPAEIGVYDVRVWCVCRAVCARCVYCVWYWVERGAVVRDVVEVAVVVVVSGGGGGRGGGVLSTSDQLPGGSRAVSMLVEGPRQQPIKCFITSPLRLFPFSQTLSLQLCRCGWCSVTASHRRGEARAVR